MASISSRLQISENHSLSPSENVHRELEMDLEGEVWAMAKFHGSLWLSISKDIYSF